MFKRIREKGKAVLLFLLFFGFYCFFQLKSIYGGDSGDFVAAAWLWGIPHPPGYPFYTIIASILVHFLPFFTPAWRIGLISSFSSALSLAVFYLLLKKITKNKTASLLATLVLGFLYPVWLYSEVAEVFTLNNLFAVLLTYVFFKLVKIDSSKIKSRLINKSNFKLVLFFVFLLGLSLSHHHVIVLLFPAFGYYFFKNKNIFKDKKKFGFKPKQLFFLFLAFILGLSFYIYPLLACRKAPLICWDDPTNLKNLWRLVSRADYGTFKAGNNFGNAPLFRAYALAAFSRLSLEDFRALGVILIFLGLFKAYKLYKKNKDYIFPFLFITLAFCIFFIFYASFMLVNDFMVATFERFLIFPYIFMSLSLGLGVSFVFEQGEVLVKKLKLSLPSRQVALIGLKTIFFILPLSIFISNFKRISILKNDLTAENMAKDFLAPLPKNSILILSSDSAIFDAQYLKYAVGFRDDVILIPFSHLPAPFFQKILHEDKPEIIFSNQMDHNKNLEVFVKENTDKYEIFVDRDDFKPEKSWAPYGLTWQYIPFEEQIATSSAVKRNMKIWEQLSDPLAGSLKQFKNLYLADVLRIYYSAQVGFGEYLVKNDYLDEAGEFFNKAEGLGQKDEAVYMGLGLVSLKKGECEQAKEMFLKALEINEKNALALGYLRKNELECFNNKERAKEFEEQCVGIQSKKETILSE